MSKIAVVPVAPGTKRIATGEQLDVYAHVPSFVCFIPLDVAAYILGETAGFDVIDRIVGWPAVSDGIQVPPPSVDFHVPEFSNPA